MTEVEDNESLIEAQTWDLQIEGDSAAGRLEALIEESMAEHEAGASRAL